MLNLKNTSKLFIAAIVFSATASFSHAADDGVFLDCSGKEGYALKICEEQKALAEKNAKSDAKAEKDAKKKLEEQRVKVNAANEDFGAANEKSKTAKTKADDALKEREKQVKAKIAAQKEMNEALKNGDMEGAETARAKMAEADSAAKKAKEELDSAGKDQKNADKEAKKAEDAVRKAAEIAYDADINAKEKIEKTADKDLKKAEKDLAKLESKCEKDPDKCDVEALQAARAKQAAAQALSDQATKDRETADGTAAAQQEAEAAALKERNDKISADYLNDIMATNAKYGEEELSADEIDSQGNPKSQQRCVEAKDRNIFHFIACKSITTLADLRVIVYTIAGFGLIAFAFAAIFNKISWKHLAHLCIALFILSMMTPFINYFAYEDGKGMTYGDYLPAGFTNIDGSDAAQKPCDTTKGDVCPDVTVDTSAKNTEWSWKDLKNTVKSTVNAAKTTYNTYKTVKNTLEKTLSEADKIRIAIKNSEGGLGGILDTVGEISTASNSIFSNVKLGAGAVVSNTSSIANDVQNAGKSGSSLAFDKENQNRIGELEKKLAAGNLNPQQAEWAKNELEQRKAAVDKNVVSDYAKNQGAKAVDKINNVAKVGGTVTKVVTNASNTAQQGANIGGGIGTTGGDIVGSIFGLASLAGEGIGASDDAKQAKIDEANAVARKKAEAEAAAKKKAEVQANNKSLSEGKKWDNSYNATYGSKAPATADASSKSAGSADTSGSAVKPDTSAGSSNSSADSSSSKDNSTVSSEAKTSAGGSKDTVTFSKTETFGGGDQGANQEGKGFSFPETTRTDTVTIDNAVKNPDGTVTITDKNGNIGTFDKNGNLLSVVNYTTGKDMQFDENGKTKSSKNSVPEGLLVTDPMAVAKGGASAVKTDPVAATGKEKQGDCYADCIKGFPSPVNYQSIGSCKTKCS